MAVKNGVSHVISRFDEVSTSLKALADRQVLVGIPREKTERDPALSADPSREDITNAAIGYINEFGEPSLNIPARPHLVPGVRNALQQIKRILKVAGEKATKGDNQGVTAALNAAGLAARESVKTKIRTGPFKELSPITIALRQRRGFMGMKPLIETAAYLNAINYVIRKRK